MSALAARRLRVMGGAIFPATDLVWSDLAEALAEASMGPTPSYPSCFAAWGMGPRSGSVETSPRWLVLRGGWRCFNGANPILSQLLRSLGDGSPIGIGGNRLGVPLRRPMVYGFNGANPILSQLLRSLGDGSPIGIGGNPNA